MYPLDTVKKLLQLEVVQCSFQSSGNELSTIISMHTPKYKNLSQCVMWVCRNEGLRGLYKGLVPSLWKSVFSTGIMFATYKSIKEFLDSAMYL